MPIMTTIADLKPDPRNARKHGIRNLSMISKSLEEVGAARSIVIDEDNVILAGNGLVESAGQLGIENVQIVDVDGETIVAVRRTGLTKAQKKRLAVLDNRAGELAEWEPDVLAELNTEGLLDGLFFDEELSAILSDIDVVAPDEFAEYDENIETEYCCPKCGYKWSGKPNSEA